MVSKKCLLFRNCFLTQYSLIFGSILLVANLCSCFGSLLSNVGLILVVSALSWGLAKKLRRRRSKEVLTSFKRAVLVTGCDTGFGNAVAHEFNRNGFRVYATVLNPDSDGAKDLVTGARFEGMTTVIKMDVTKDEDVKTVFEQIKNDLEQNKEELWAVVNNAGILTLGQVDWGTIQTYKDVFEVNTFGTVRVTRAFLPLIRKSKGRFVNLVSMAGRYTATNMAIYCMSKHATISFSDALRRENKKYGVTVVTVEPMAYRTTMMTEGYIDREYDKQWNESSDEVKEFYGEEFLKKLKDNKHKGHVVFPPGENIYDVVDTLVEAVRSPVPQIRYQVTACQFLLRSFMLIAPWLPIELYDFTASNQNLFIK